MPSAGELLRSERLRLNRNLSEIAEFTCISSRYLEAIESDNLHILPGVFFYRSFVKQYALALRLDPVTISQILGLVSPMPQVDVLPGLTLAYEAAAEAQRSSSRYKARPLVALVLLVAVIAGSSGVSAWYHKRQSDAEVAPKVNFAPTVHTVHAASVAP